jgi:hypothetical protein
MGGRTHADEFYSLWQGLNVRFASWTSFAVKGQEYIEYDKEDVAVHPGGRPLVKGGSIERLLTLMRTFDQAHHVLLVGFSAGAYLALKTIQAMEAEPIQQHATVSFLAIGHYLFADELMADSVAVTPGVIIFGEDEMTAIAKVHGYGRVHLAELSDHLSADSFMVSTWGGYCGDPRKCALTERLFENAHILMALECGHSISDYEWALWRQRMFYMAGRQLPSSLATSSRSSAYSSDEFAEPRGARGRSHSI